MGKPEIIGWEPDPNASPESQALWGLYDIGKDAGGWYFQRSGMGSRLHLPIASERAVMMRWLGMKPVYREREFRFVPDASGHQVTCKTCGETSWTGILPHDYARWHSRRYHGPKYAVSDTQGPMGSTLGLEPGKLAPQLVVQLEPEPEVEDDDLPCPHEITWMGSCVGCGFAIPEDW